MRVGERPGAALHGALALRTLAIGGLGGAVCMLAGLPAAWLSGGMLAVALAALARVRVAQPQGLRDAFFVVLGITIGAGVRPETLARMGEWPVTMAMLLATVVAVLLATYAYQRRVAGWDRETAYFAAVPGTLGLVMALMQSYPRAEPVRVALAQTVRLFVLVAILPSLIPGDGSLPVPDGPDPRALGPAGLVPFLGVASLLGWGAARLGVPAGWLTAPFFLSAAANASGLFVVVLPPWLVALSMVGLGSWIGSRFADVSLALLARLFTVSLGAFAVGMGIALAMSGFVAWGLGLPFGQVLLAFAPGGLEAMTLLAFLLNLDPAFVAAHQLARYIAMVVLIPAITRRVLGPPAALAARGTGPAGAGGKGR